MNKTNILKNNKGFNSFKYAFGDRPKNLNHDENSIHCTALPPGVAGFNCVRPFCYMAHVLRTPIRPLEPSGMCSLTRSI